MITDLDLAESTLVYWCKKDQWFVPLADGPICPSMDCTNETWTAHSMPPTRMRKRRGWVCTEPGCGSVVFGTKTYAMSYYKENHVHHEFD